MIGLSYADVVRVWRRHLIALLAALLVALLIAGLGRSVARAEETPVAVPLTYVAGLSNWGPTTASGSAEVWLIEAEVRLHVSGLPVLNNQLYDCWLVDQSTNRFLNIGRFNVGGDGTALVDFVLKGSLPAEYNLVLVTVQPASGGTSSPPSTIYSIAGYFPGNVAKQHQVQHLPDTGANAQHPPFEFPATARPGKAPLWLALIPLIAAIVSFGLIMRRRAPAR